MANYLCTLRGTLSPNTLGEQFSHSLAIVSASTAQVVATEVKDAFQAQWGAAVPPLSADFPVTVTYTEATAAEILNLNTGVLAAAHHVLFDVYGPGTGAGDMLPSQTAIAVSLYAGLRNNGTRMKGRFYLPPPIESQSDANGMIQLGFQQRIADYMSSFLATLQASQHFPAVWSRTEGRLSTVDGVRVGNKYDTIRRRRNKLPETYEVRMGLVP